MKQLTRGELEKARILKAARAAIRLRHSLDADEELNRVLPELERRCDQALKSGRSLSVTILELDEGDDDDEV